MLQIPSTLNATPIVPPAVDSTNYGMAFRKLVPRRDPDVSTYDTSTLGNASGTISMVNVHPINGYIYDANENRIS